MEACPVCRASLNGASTCRRCRADLQKVQEVERRGQALAGAAMLALAEGDLAAGAHWLDRARVVHATPAVRALQKLITDPQLPDEEEDEDEAVSAARPQDAAVEPAGASEGRTAPTAPDNAHSFDMTPSCRPSGQVFAGRLWSAPVSLLAAISKNRRHALTRMARWLPSLTGLRGQPERRASLLDQRPHPSSNFLGQEVAGPE